MIRTLKKNKTKSVSSSRKQKGRLKPVAKPETLVEEEKTTLQVVKSNIKWDDAYPFVVETIKTKAGDFVDVPKYYPIDDPALDRFLYEVIRSNNLPIFVKNNFKKLRKLLEKEIEHRLKLVEKLSREQSAAFCSFFSDDMYFARSSKNEYYEHELEKVFVDFLKNYCTTGSYDSRVRSAIRRRKEILEKLQNG